MAKIIARKENFTLFNTMNTYDTNYHLVDNTNDIDYLIDVGDVFDTIEGDEDYTTILWDDLKELNNIEEIIDASWKQVEVDSLLKLNTILDSIKIA